MALQQLAATLGSRLLQQSARSQGFSQLSISLLPGQQHLQLARGCALSQQRALVTIDVVNNQVDRALKTLKRKVVEEGLPKQWKAHEVGGWRECTSFARASQLAWVLAYLLCAGAARLY